MTDEEFERIYSYVKKRYGIDMSRKKELMESRLDGCLKDGGFNSYSAYMNAVENDFAGKYETELVNLLSTNHTFFMREFEHFDFLQHEVLPWLKRKEEQRRDLGIWCAAASTGQEPYMLAMLIKDFFGWEHGQWDTRILATDISTEALEKAIRGRYSREQIMALPEMWRRRYFRLAEDKQDFEVIADIKKEILFRRFNLMDVFPFKKKMHVVFLRNVMIYFDQETKAKLIKKVYDVMEPGGYLFVGQTETIDKEDNPFELIRPSIFRKQERNR